MEKAKISASQLFVLMVLFGNSSALLLPLAVDPSSRRRGLRILLSTVGGIFLFLVHYKLYQFYPTMLPTEYMQKILGKTVGSIVGFLYLLYFLHWQQATLRVFGDLLVTFAYSETPLIALTRYLY